MVIKGSSRGGGIALAAHLSRVDTNERVEVVELSGVAALDLEGALREIEAVGSGARTKKPFYHASINTAPNEYLTDQQRARAIDVLEKAMGLEGQPRVVVAHKKKDRDHVHVVWSRIDLENMRGLSDSHNYRRHEGVSRQLELEFKHAYVQGAHVGREGVKRPARTATHAEMQQAERSGLTLKNAKTLITEIWIQTDNGRAFANALQNAGWILARGDRRDFVALDPEGEIHSLARRIDGAKTADIRARLADLNQANLPSVSEARIIQDQRATARAALEADKKPEKHSAGVRDELRVTVATDNAGMVAQQSEALRTAPSRKKLHFFGDTPEPPKNAPSSLPDDMTDRAKRFQEQLDKSFSKADDRDRGKTR